jgi:hypothetical protein
LPPSTSALTPAAIECANNLPASVANGDFPVNLPFTFAPCPIPKVIAANIPPFTAPLIFPVATPPDIKPPNQML